MIFKHEKKNIYFKSETKPFRFYKNVHNSTQIIVINNNKKEPLFEKTNLKILKAHFSISDWTLQRFSCRDMCRVSPQEFVSSYHDVSIFGQSKKDRMFIYCL